MSELVSVLVPDLGGASQVSVIEVLAKVGDQITTGSALIILEGDKASMEVPSSEEGKIEEILVNVGDKVSKGTVICKIVGNNKEPKIKVEGNADKFIDSSKEAASPVLEKDEELISSQAVISKPHDNEIKEDFIGDLINAGPGARQLARALEIPLNSIAGSGPKNRITKNDVENYAKEMLKNKRQTVSGFNIPDAPVIDFSQFGKIEHLELSKIKKATANNMHRSWISVPHVTQFDEADITELEKFRRESNVEAKAKNIKLTILPFIIKSVSSALLSFPNINSSLDPSGENLILKKYINIGIAVDTPNGLVVPVIRDVDKKGVFTLAKEISELSEKAKNMRLSLNEMQGGCFTISSLGGVGGTSFTPIINFPEVAILGVSKASIKPTYINEEFVPRLFLPLSLSYDHRVIDGVEGAKFMLHIVNCLSNIKNLLLS